MGVEAVELEAKVPGQSKHVFDLFGVDGGRFFANSVQTEDMPRLIKYGEKADRDETRRLLLKAYEKEGKSLFERIPPRLVLASGLTAAMLYGTHRVTSPDLLRALSDRITSLGVGLAFVVVVLVLWRFGLMPWHRKSRESGPSRK